MAKTANKKLVIIDGKSVFYRGYYAMPNLSTKDGTATGGVYGFAVLSMELLKRLKPDYVCVAWDKPKTNIRKRLELYPQYKAGRKPPPEDFYTQIPILHNLLESLGWPLYEYDDYEADDIMATLAKKAEAKGIETILISSDLDMLQSVTEMTHMYALKKGFSNIQKFDPKTFEDKFGVTVDQFIDLKSIMGDSSDNIPGVMGIGKKGAAELLQEYTTLENVYDNLDMIKASLRKKLIASKDMAFLSKKLVTLMLDAPVPLELDAMDVTKLDPSKLVANLKELEFTSLLRQIPKEMMDMAEPLPASTAASELKMPLIKVHSSLNEIAKLDWSKPVFVHAHCKDRFGGKPQVVLASDDNKTVHIYEAANTKAVNIPGDQLLINGFDTKRIVQMFIKLGVTNVSVEHDAHVGAYLLNPLMREQSLSAVALDELGYSSELDSLDVDSYKTKAPEIAAIIWALIKAQKTDFKKLPKLAKLAVDIEWPVIPNLARIELTGMKLDTSYLDVMRKDLEGKISNLQQTIYGYADAEFNISSPAQLSEVLFGSMGLPTKGIKKGKTSYSTAASELAKLKGLSPIIDCISDYRELSKLKNTYVDALPDHQDADGRVRSDLRLTVAATGRLSSSDPNLQNIPVRTATGKLIRNAFTAEKGNVLVSADYSQFELRLSAVMSGDKGMINAFNSDIDIHTLTASQVFGVALEEVTKEQRYSAKAVNFGILYGQGVHGLAQQTGMNYVEAKEFIEKYFEQRSALRDYIKGLREIAKNDGFVETLFGRRRPTPDVASSNFMVREAAYRQAINMPIQGTEADLMKMAMVKLEQVFESLYGAWQLKDWKDPKQIMQVHDSIIVECAAAQADEVQKVMVEVMEGIYPKIGIKLKVDVSSGTNWGEL